MALVISAVQVTGTATAYTVPTGKVAKVRLVSVDNLNTGKYIYIGNYTAYQNTNGYGYTSKYQAQASAGTNYNMPPVAGFVRITSNVYAMNSSFMYIKEDHVLVAGETVRQTDASATFAYTIFEEDV
tara:strand:- start:843 stop:1223 length:381 start_codon:yes stop_codon:yes gene_type:complete